MEEKTKNLKTLVIGASGATGKEVVNQLIMRGENVKMIVREEKEILEQLDKAVKEEDIKQHLMGVIQRVEQSLKENPESLMSWEPIPLELFKQKLPNEIKSSWVFNLRKNSTTGAERHPNSIQRMMSYKGHGDFQTKPEKEWKSNFLESDLEGAIEKRWISIPINVWHQGIVSNENWIVISFHTAEVSELIEERPEDGNENNLHQQKYIDKH